MQLNSALDRCCKCACSNTLMPAPLVRNRHCQQQQQLRLQQQQQRHPCLPLQQQQQQHLQKGASTCRLVRSGRVRVAADPMAASVVASTAASEDNGPPPAPCTKQQLLDLAATFVKLWFAGIAKGPQAVEQELAGVLAPDVLIKADRVKHIADKQGLPEVLAELERAHLEYHRSEHRPMLYGASQQVQRAYALVEGTYQDVGALPGHPATFRISKVHHILSMEVQGGRISVLWLCRQLTEEDKDELLHEPLACYPAPFPRDSLLLADPGQHDAQSGSMVDAVHAWWRAWAAGPAKNDVSSSSSNNHGSSSNSNRSGSGSSSSPVRKRRHDDTAAVAQLLAPDFKMWDAYGLYPAMRAHGRRHLNKDAAIRYMQSVTYSYNVELTVLDVTVAEGSLACFSHWQARLHPKWSGAAASDSSSGPSFDAVEAVDAASARSSGRSSSSGGGSSTSSSTSSSAGAGAVQQQAAQPHEQQDTSVLVVDGMSIDLFDEGMQLKVIWSFRSPVTHAERQLFLQYDRQQAAAQAAQAASEQEAIRAERRAQREQQLSELLAWMNNYQQQWSAYVTHVQKQLARQQRLAKQQLIQQLQDSQDMDGSLDEEELDSQAENLLGKQLQQQLVQAQQQLQSLQQQAQQQLQNLTQQQPTDSGSSSSSHKGP